MNSDHPLFVFEPQAAFAELENAFQELADAQRALADAVRREQAALTRKTKAVQVLRHEIARTKNWCGFCGINCTSDHK